MVSLPPSIPSIPKNGHHTPLFGPLQAKIYIFSGKSDPSRIMTPKNNLIFPRNRPRELSWQQKLREITTNKTNAFRGADFFELTRESLFRKGCSSPGELFLGRWNLSVRLPLFYRRLISQGLPPLISPRRDG